MQQSEARVIPKLSSLLCGVALALLVSSAVADEQPSITISTWGGAYQAAQQQALFTPFEAQTGIKINTQLQQGGLDMLTGDNVPDLVDMEEADGQLACEKGLLHKMDFVPVVAPEKAGLSVKDDFLPKAFLPCGVAHMTFATLVAFNTNAFQDEKPSTIKDFFDLKRFPGKRGLRKNSGTILEWALMADGVPISQVYDLLSTERGLRLAFRRLESLRGNIVWWDKPEEPGQLLSEGKVTMSSGYNGRFFDDQTSNKAITLLWDGQIIDRSIWVIPAAIKKPGPALTQFIRFATQPKQMARLAERIPYGPSRSSALKYIGNHPIEGTLMMHHLPTNPNHLKRSLFRDTGWYAKTDTLRSQAFDRWLSLSKGLQHSQ
ncbi:extracellular solute-binding protein [Leucothrix mucor]|uniref:extracellular solute-binding protein n=1 Tax=Leucothrix mucor TaxID=45248 RepID=UPI0003B717EC|nr:extracellular solute-binding protein [Leucothrix mucor]